MENVGVMKILNGLFRDPIFSEQIILEKLNSLKVSKSLFETSYKLDQLPADWKSGYITAIFKKGNKSDPSNPSVLPVLFVK